MTSVRKRKWRTRSGEKRKAWVVDYNDGPGGARRLRTFGRESDAIAFRESLPRPDLVSEPVDDRLAGDLLAGAAAIAAFMGWSTRAAFHLLEKGHLPAFKIGRKWYARRSTLLSHIAKLEAEESQ